MLYVDAHYIIDMRRQVLVEGMETWGHDVEKRGRRSSAHFLRLCVCCCSVAAGEERGEEKEGDTHRHPHTFTFMHSFI